MTTFFILITTLKATWTKRNYETFTNSSLTKPALGVTLAPKDGAKTCLTVKITTFDCIHNFPLLSTAKTPHITLQIHGGSLCRWKTCHNRKDLKTPAKKEKFKRLDARMYQKMLLFQRGKRNKTFLDAYLTQLKPFQWCLISKWILVQYREIHLQKVSIFFSAIVTSRFR